MAMDRKEQRIEAAYLSGCDSQAAYSWLYERKHADGEKSSFLEEAPKVLEYLLVRRKDSLIDLAIARFGNSSDAIRKVFKRGNIGVRCAALSNPNIGPASGLFREGWLQDSDIREIISSNMDVELESLAKNNYLDDDAIKHLLNRSEEFSDLTDDQYVRMLVWLGSNPRMSSNYDSRLLDGWAEYSHGEVFSLAWQLARTLPVTKTNAYVLYELLQHTSAPVGYENPEQVIDRWRIEEKPKDGERPLAYSYYLRTRLADVLKADNDLLNSDDPALRESFYRRFSAWEYKDWPKFIEKDGELAFDAVVENEELWHSEETRKLLQDTAWKVPDPHSSMMAPNTYNAVEDRHRKLHPAWFGDEDAEYGSDPNSVIRRLEKQVTSIAEALKLKPERDDDVSIEVKENLERIEQLLEQSEYSDDEKQNELSQRIHEIKEEILEQRTAYQSPACRFTPPAIWPWLVTIFLLILVLLK